MYGYYSCPSCVRREVRRSRTRGIERLLKLFTRSRPYRCLSCGWRGWCREQAAELRPRQGLLTHLPFHKT